jgi:nitric oxide reductase FlRd-NAD(+) reductase
MTSPLIIVGSGLAGLGVARAVRRNDHECEMILICADSYSKPQLSIALSAKKTASDLVLASAEESAADPRLQL